MLSSSESSGSCHAALREIEPLLQRAPCRQRDQRQFPFCQADAAKE